MILALLYNLRNSCLKNSAIYNNEHNNEGKIDMIEQKNLENMPPKARQELILDIIKSDKFIKVSDLSKKLYINEATIRRDLNALEEERLVKRVYGGAVLSSGQDSEIPLMHREVKNAVQKKHIAENAAKEVENGDTIFLDSSSTVSFMIPFLESKSGLRIVTNGAKTTLLLSRLHNAEIISLGGRLRENSLSFSGLSTFQNLSEYFFDKAFFSCHAYSEEFGLMDNNEDEARLRRLLVGHSRKTFFLADASKEGKTSFYKICDIDDIYKVIKSRTI